MSSFPPQRAASSIQEATSSTQITSNPPAQKPEEKIEKITEATPQARGENTAPEALSQPQAPVSSEAVATQTEETAIQTPQVPAPQSAEIAAPSAHSELDFKTLWQTIVAQISKPTLQANLKDTAIIEKKEGNLIHLTVITKIAEMLINNEENRKQIESLLSQALGEPVQIQMTYESKESYFARKMGM